MRLSILSAVSLSATTATAYLNTSPFFLFSTSSDFSITGNPSIESSSEISKAVSRELASCQTKNYIIVSQPGVSISDYYDGENVPTLSSNIRSTDLRRTTAGSGSTIIVSEVIGRIETQEWADSIVQKCNTSSTKVDGTTDTIPPLSSSNLIEITFPAPSESSRLADIKKHDAFLASVLDKLPSAHYTVLYTTTPRSSESRAVDAGEKTTQYQMEQPLFDMPQTELKRDLSSHKRQDDDVTLVDGPLFDRYQFFTPGIWMGFLAAILLVSILYVGISAISGLKVSYAAFDKENGPQASRKVQ